MVSIFLEKDHLLLDVTRQAKIAFMSIAFFQKLFHNLFSCILLWKEGTNVILWERRFSDKNKSSQIFDEYIFKICIHNTWGLVWSNDILFSKMKAPLPNPSHPNPRQREKTNLVSFFTLICGTSKGFVNVFKTFTKPFEAPQGGVKIKI